MHVNAGSQRKGHEQQGKTSRSRALERKERGAEEFGGCESDTSVISKPRGRRSRNSIGMNQ